MGNQNNVVEVYKGIKIRRSNRYVFRFSPAFYKFLILESERTGLPISKILSLSSAPCQSCMGINIITYNKQDEMVEIKRGILSRHHPESNGSPIMQQASKKK